MNSITALLMSELERAKTVNDELADLVIAYARPADDEVGDALREARSKIIRYILDLENKLQDG
jgi:hypothetical protein